MNKKIILLTIFFAIGIFYSYSAEKDNLQKQEEIEQEIIFDESEKNEGFEDIFRGIEIEDKKLTFKDYAKLIKEYIKQNKKAQAGIGITATALTIAILKYKKKI